MTQQAAAAHNNPYEKDCGCLNHQGPCWLKSDYDDLQRNLPLLEQAIGHAQGDNIHHGVAFHGFVQQEERRLFERKYQVQDGIQYPYSLLGAQYEDLQARRIQLLQEYERAVQDMAERKRQRDLAYCQVPEPPVGPERKRLLQSCLKFQVEHLEQKRFLCPVRTVQELATWTERQRENYVAQQKVLRFNTLSLSLLIQEAQRLRVALPPGTQPVMDLAATVSEQERAEWVEVSQRLIIPESIKSARIQRDEFLKGYGSPDVPLETKLRNIDNSIALFALIHALLTQTARNTASVQPAQQQLFEEGA